MSISAVSWAILATTAAVAGGTYCAYPMGMALLAGLFSRGKPGPAARPAGESNWPRVSFVIAAYNESAVIQQKLEQTLALATAERPLEVIVASDGSDDGTDDLVRAYAEQGVRLVNPGRVGKTPAAVAAARAASGDILVFSDATSEWSEETLTGLVAALEPTDVGAASGRVMYRYGRSMNASGFRFYQRFTVALRSAERLLGSQASVSGACHAVRREAFVPVAGEQSYDLCHPLHVAKAGLRTVYVSEAVCWEEARDDEASEFRARVRAGVIAWTFLPYLLRSVPEVRQPGYLLQVGAHKLARWILPLLLLASLPAAAQLAVSGSMFGFYLFAAQVALYAGATGAWALRKWGIRLPGVGIPLLFCVTNLAFLVGLKRYLAGERMAVWNPEAQRL